MGNYLLFVCLRKGLTLAPMLACNSLQSQVDFKLCQSLCLSLPMLDYGYKLPHMVNYFCLCSTGFSTDRWVPFPSLGAGVFSQLALIDRMGQRQHYQNPMSTSFCSLGAQLPHHEKAQFVEEGGHGGENSEAHAKASTSCLSSE